MKFKKMLAMMVAAGMMASMTMPVVAAEKTQLNVATELMNAAQITWDLSYSWFVMRWGVTECLIKNADDGSFEPWLATDWSVSDDGLTWTFQLRDDVKFSNGNPMTATSVKESIENLYTLQDPENGGTGDIQSFMTYTSIEADDGANTIAITTTNQQPDMLGVMAYPMMGVIDVAASLEEGRNTEIEGVIGTGPYVYTSFTQDHDIQLAKNEYYWGGEVPFETVNILKVSESATRSMSLQDGSADMAINISATDRTVLEASGNYEISLVSGSRDGYYHINFDGPLGNDALRKALHMAVDGETICNISTQGAYTYGYTPLSPTYDFGSDTIEDPYPYDPEAAMALLDEAGIVDTDNDGYRELDGENISLSIVTTSSRQMDVIANAVAISMEAIGVHTEVVPVDSQNEYMMSGKFDLVNSNEMVMPTGDPTGFLRHWYSKLGTDIDYSRYENEEYDALYEELSTEMDETRRKEIVTRMQEILVEDAVLLMGGYYNFNICASSTITGVYNPTCDFYWITSDIKPVE